MQQTELLNKVIEKLQLIFCWVELFFFVWNRSYLEINEMHLSFCTVCLWFQKYIECGKKLVCVVLIHTVYNTTWSHEFSMHCKIVIIFENSVSNKRHDHESIDIGFDVLWINLDQLCVHLIETVFRILNRFSAQYILDCVLRIQELTSLELSFP